jgi:hypothetical protein
MRLVRRSSKQRIVRRIDVRHVRWQNGALFFAKLPLLRALGAAAMP